MSQEAVFDLKTTKELYSAYKKNKKAGKERHDTFKFKGMTLVMSYCKYLLIFLGNRFPDAKIKLEE